MSSLNCPEPVFDGDTGERLMDVESAIRQVIDLVDNIGHITALVPEVWYVDDGKWIVEYLVDQCVEPGFEPVDPLVEKVYSNSRRARLVARDGWNCHYCQHPLGWGDRNVVRPPEIEHVIPKSRGGKDAFHNLVLACDDCNDDKGVKTPLEWLGAENICCRKHLEVFA